MRLQERLLYDAGEVDLAKQVRVELQSGQQTQVGAEILQAARQRVGRSVDQTLL
jgi:hypothetical protein